MEKNKPGNHIYKSCWSVVLVLILAYACHTSKVIISTNDFSTLELASFVEPDFPYITTSMDTRNMGHGLPDTNVVARGLAIQLGNGAYACFDTDLMRWAVAWTGDFMSLVLSAQVSYANFFKENKDELPKVLGTPAIATGLYAGWSIDSPYFQDPRPSSQEVEGWRWGPVPTTIGRWNGAYIHGNSVVLSYSIGSTDIVELPGSEISEGLTVFTRTFRMGKSDHRMYLNVAETTDGTEVKVTGNSGFIFHGERRDSVTAVSVQGGHGAVKISENRYISVELPHSTQKEEFTVVVWKGRTTDLVKFERIATGITKSLPDYEKGGPGYWRDDVITSVQPAPDTAAFVTDRIMLPVPNPWKRNVRIGDIGFFKNGDAAVSTYEGDVWIIEGLNKSQNKIKWRRFASGLFEPMSIEIVSDQIFVFGKDGILRLHDLNGDGEADYYENFCNLMQQSVGVREWAADMVADADGNFYIAKGGHVTQYGDLLPYLSGTKAEHPWRASTRHSGSILKISSDGRSIEVIATGLRVPYLGIHRGKGIVTASDQQGNFVPATPIYSVRKGDYFGVETTRHRKDIPEIPEPIVWMPHRIERSGISQTWIENGKMGPLNNQMIHFSFGRPGLFRVLLDSTSQSVQGGVELIYGDYPAPVMKGEVNPRDGQLYFTGFNNYASNSKGISALLRLRYTGLPSYQASGFQVGRQGIILSFDSQLEVESITPENFRIKRWNYLRTEQYGSGHYRIDGSPGEELLAVHSTYLSEDKRRILLAVAMEKAEQIEITYDITAPSGKIVKGSVWLTAKALSKLDLKGFPVSENDLELTSSEAIVEAKASSPASAERGKELFSQIGCSGCHSPFSKTMGMYGPPLGRIFGTVRQFEDGTSGRFDESYAIESILEPSKKVVKGYNSQMPSYLGILSESELESIVLYIKSLQ